MLGLINAVTATFGAIDRYVKQGLVMANRFLTPPKLSHPAQGSAEFDGASDYIQLNTPFSYTSHTIAAWVYHGDVDTFNRLFDNRSSGADSDAISIYLGSANDVINYSVCGTGITQQSSAFLNEWYFFTGTYDGSTMKLYINGSLDNSTGKSASVNATQNARIGSNAWITANRWNGNLANVAIWNRALSSDEINSVMWKGYQSLTSSEKDGLQAWYKLEESELFNASNTSTTNLEQYAQLNNLTFEGKTCLQTALDGFPDITDARLYSGKYDARVSGDGGTVEALNCVETELNALL
jgi:hypothetical protein